MCASQLKEDTFVIICIIIHPLVGFLVQRIRTTLYMKAYIKIYIQYIVFTTGLVHGMFAKGRKRHKVK